MPGSETPLTPRDAIAADYPHFLMFWGELGITQAPPPAATWATTMAPRTFFLETPAGERAAYAMITPYGANGDVRQIVVAPGWRARGVGRQLMAVVAARLRAAGCATWQLEVKADNAAGHRLYQSVGMTIIGEQHGVHLPWDAVARLPVPTRRLVSRAVAPAEDAAVEAAFGQFAGRLADLRARRPDGPIHRLHDEDAPAEVHLGLARYLPGAFVWPFQVTDPSYAGTLLAGVTAGSAPTPHLEIFIDDSHDLLTVLYDLGGTPQERLLIMRGTL